MKNIFLSAMFFLLFGISAGIAEAVTSDIMLYLSGKGRRDKPFQGDRGEIFRHTEGIQRKGTLAQRTFYPALGRDREEQGWQGLDRALRNEFGSVRKPLCVLLKSGSYLYDPEKNMLKMLSDKNSLSRAARQGTQVLRRVFCLRYKEADRV